MSVRFAPWNGPIQVKLWQGQAYATAGGAIMNFFATVRCADGPEIIFIEGASRAEVIGKLEDALSKYEEAVHVLNPRGA